MNRFFRTLGAVLCLAAGCLAQTFPTPSYMKQLFSPQDAPSQLAAPQALEQYIVDGKLTLGLQDAIRLMLLNNTEVRINQLQQDQARFAELRSHSPFDPVVNANFTPQRSTSPTTTTLAGAQTLSDLTQNTNVSYNQLFLTGTNLNVRFNTTRSTTNSTFATFNPSFFSGSTFTLSQPLLRGRGLVATRGPIEIARRNFKQSRANFEASLNQSLTALINQYWAVVQAQKSLAVLQNSLKLAEESYKRDKRALELGALSPLEIYRSEGTVAQRRLQLIQAEFNLKSLQDALRRTIGADIDSRAAVVDIVLTEPTDVPSELATVDLPTALQTALSKRPELEAVRLQVANDDTSVGIAQNGLKPDFNVSAFYTSNGRGGNQIATVGGVPVIVAPGGFRDSLDQVGSFDFPSYGLNLQLRLPIRNRAAQADLGSALASKKSSLYRLRQQEQGVNQEVRDSVNALERSKLSITAATTARDLAAKTMTAEQRKYELGAQTIFFVLEAQNALLVAEQNFVQAQIDYQRAVAEFDRATGELLEKNRVLIRDTVQ